MKSIRVPAAVDLDYRHKSSGQEQLRCSTCPEGMNRVQRRVLTNRSKHSVESALIPLLTDALIELKYNCLVFAGDCSVGEDVAERPGPETMKIKPGTQVLVCTCTFVVYYMYNKSTTVFGCFTRLIGSSDMDLEGANGAAVVPSHVPNPDF